MQETWLPTLKYSPGPGAAIFSARTRGAVASRKHAQPRQHGREREEAFRAMNEVTLRAKPRPLYYGVVDQEYLTRVHYTLHALIHPLLTYSSSCFMHKDGWNHRGVCFYLLWPKSGLFKSFCCSWHPNMMVTLVKDLLKRQLKKSKQIQIQTKNVFYYIKLFFFPPTIKVGYF